MTGKRDNCFPHIRLLPTHPHLASADFIRLLPFATSAHPQIRLLPIAVSITNRSSWPMKVSDGELMRERYDLYLPIYNSNHL